MSGGGSGPGVPYPGEGASISVGGVSVEIPYVDPSTPHGLRIRDISLCVAIQQMASSISEESIRTALQSAAAQALNKEAHLLLSEVESGSSTAAPQPAMVG